MWTLLEGYANRVVNEFFVDVRDRDPDDDELYNHLESVVRRSGEPSGRRAVTCPKEPARARPAPSTAVRSTRSTDRSRRSWPSSTGCHTTTTRSCASPRSTSTTPRPYDVDVATSSHASFQLFKSGFPIRVRVELIYGGS